MKSYTHSKPIILPVLILGVFASFGLLPEVKALVPAPDGGYPGGNTAEGQAALLSLTTGTFNTGAGYLSLRGNSTASFNTGVGAGTLLANTADNNTAIGAGALLSNTIGIFNTANGAFGLFTNTEGHHNTAVGARALFGNTTGEENTALGFGALGNNTGGNQNAATGSLTLANNITGSHNTANGDSALLFNTTGNNNIALGFSAGSNVTTASNVICIGAQVAGFNVDDSCFIGNIRDALVAPDAVAVLVDSTGKLGTRITSNRSNEEITPIGRASEGLYALVPVTFHYKTEIDPAGTSQFGLVAEEVEKVNSDLIVRDHEGKPYSVRYDQVNWMLLNEFLKEHKKVEEQQATIGQLKSNAAKQEATMSELNKNVEVLTAQLREQAAQIQKVSAQIETGRPAPNVVVNGR